MDITLKDLMQSGKLKDLKLLAGKNGLNNKITGCTILDFQFDRTLNILKPEYYFNSHQLVLTSFLYAKDNEFLILDALKKLTERGACGLAINNIYKLPINDMIIKIADSKNFPLFLFNSPNIRTENIILSIDQSINQFKNIFHFEKIIDEIIHNNDIDKNVYKLYSNINELYICAYFKPNNAENIKAFNSNLHNELAKIPFNEINYVQYKYKNGSLLIFSFDTINSNESLNKIKNIFELYSKEYKNCSLGISSIHNNINTMNKAIQECIFASAYAKHENINYAEYFDLGMYKLILPYCNSTEFTEYENNIIGKIKSHDSVNSTKLIDALTAFIKFRGNIHNMSEATKQHENTIRNKLEKIKNITGLDFKKSCDYEQLSMAVKIYNAKEIIKN